MRNKLAFFVAAALSILSLFAPASTSYAASVLVKETCNVSVTFRMTVPDSVQQGSTFSITDISVQPANSYGFTVTSSIFDMTATGTSSTAYSQNFITTDPAPTTGHNTYKAIYPNWAMNASGAVGSSIVIKAKKSVTIVQGYGTVKCDFTSTLATIPIVAASAPSPAPSTTPAPSTAPSTAPTTTKTPTSTTTPRPSTTPQSETPAPSTTPAPGTTDTTDSTDAKDEALTVVPLIIRVRDESGKNITNAEVTLNGTKKLKTNSNGEVTFANVLTGNHSVVVTYANKKVSHSIQVDAQDVGTAVVISLPADPVIMNPFVIGGITAGTLAISAPLAFFAVRRYRSRPGLDIPADAVPLQGVISGSATPAIANTTISHIPAIPVFPAQPATPSPAPWDPATPTPATQQVVSFDYSALANQPDTPIVAPQPSPTVVEQPATTPPIPQNPPVGSIESAIQAQVSAPIPPNNNT